MKKIIVTDEDLKFALAEVCDSQEEADLLFEKKIFSGLVMQLAEDRARSRYEEKQSFSKIILMKFGGAWYLETLFKGLFVGILGLSLLSLPFFLDFPETDILGIVLLVILGILSVWFGSYLLFSAKEMKGRVNPNPYIDPW